MKSDAKQPENSIPVPLERTGMTVPLTSLKSGRGILERLAPLWALLFFTALSIFMTWPLALRMRDAVVGEIGDNIYFIFLIRWYQKAWFELGISPFFHPWLNFPQGWNLASTDTSLATTLFGLPVSLLWGPTFGYNFAMLMTFILSGWAMFTWVRRLSGSALAGLVGGTIYAFLPYRMAHFLIGHMNLSGTVWFPFYFMSLYELLREPKMDRKSLAIGAISLGLIGFSSMHYLLMTAVMTVVFIAGYLLLVEWKRLKAWAYWRKLLPRLVIFGLAALPLVLLSALPFLGLNSQGGLASRTVDYASMYSASPTDFILPSTDHFLWGNWVGSHFDRSLWIEASFYIGAVALGLAVLAWVRRKRTGHAALMKVALFVIIVSFILGLGIYLHWDNQRVEVPVPGFLQTLIDRETAPIPLPAYFLFKYVPFYSKMRAVMRMGFFLLIFSPMMAGLGASLLFNRVAPRWTGPLAALLIALVLFDFYPGPYTQFAKVESRPVDAWLAEQSGQGAVAQFPFIQAEDQDQIYNTLTHGKPFIGGFFSANQPEQYLRIRPVLSDFPSVEGAALLKGLGVQWVLFDTRQYEDFSQVRRQVEDLGLIYRETVGSEAVFELVE